MSQATETLAEPVLARKIAAEIEDMITRCAYRPGDRLKETEFAARFCVSRASIRDAFRLLELKGFVQIAPRHGARVTRLSIADIVDTFDVQTVLFGLAAHQAAEAGMPGRLAQCKRLIGQMDVLATNPTASARRYVELTVALQKLIVDAADNTRLKLLFEQLGNQAMWQRLWFTSPPDLDTQKRRLQSARHWAKFLDHVIAQDGAKAEALAKTIFNASKTAALKRLIKEVE